MEKYFDLENRTGRFAKDCRSFARNLFHHKILEDDLRQLIRSSGSVAANYIEGNEALGRKDRLLRYRISRKESKESRLWLDLLQLDHSGIMKDTIHERERLSKEASEILKILSTIIIKFEG